MMRATIIAMTVAVSACRISADHYFADDDGVNADAGDDAGVELPSIAHSGSRLQVIDRAFPDGTKHPEGVHDSQLGVDCGATAWEDGGMYCTPLGGSVLFADSTCTTPVISPFGSAQSAPVFAPLLDQTNKVSHLYLAGNPTIVSQAYFKSSGLCSPTGTSNLLSVAREVMPSELEPMSITTDDAGAYSNRYVHGADGLLTLDDNNVLHDNARAEDCYVNSQGPGWPKSYCIPEAGEFTGSYLDSKCAQPILIDPPASVQYAAVFSPPDKCFVISEIHALGASVGIPAQIYGFDNTTGNCAVQGPASVPYVALGPAMALPELVHRPVAQPGRRIENGAIAGGGQSFVQRDFYDTTLGTWCSVRTMPDGQLVCIPEGLGVQTLFSDATCTMPVPVVDWSSSLTYCGVGFPSYGVETGSNSVQVRPVLQSPAGQLYRMATTCEAVPPNGGHYYLRAGDPLPLAMFATATLVTEPTVP